MTAWKKKSSQDLFLDTVGLSFQGLFVPWLATLVAKQALPFLVGLAPVTLHLPALVVFLLPLTLVDYLYYWNHRLLHTRKLWPLHLTHHTTEEMHWSVSSRNSQWTCFFLVYIWFQILIIYFLDNPFYYSLGMTVNGVLDLWRHSGMRTPKSLVRKIWFLVSPEDHEWHHRFGGDGKNFGANLSLWDRMHGTYEAPQEHKPRLGIGYRSSWVNEFWRPWRATKPRNSL